MLQCILTLWHTIPAEQRGWLEFWAFCAFVAVARWALHRWLPQAAARKWVARLDKLVQLITANSTTISSRRARLRDQGGDFWLLPKVDLPDERTPSERPSKRG